MRKAILAIVMLVLMGFIYSNVISSFSSVFSVMNQMDSKSLFYRNPQSLSELNVSTQDFNVSGEFATPNLKSGVYSADEVNESLLKELLDTTDWYVGNTTLSSDYAVAVYNDTLKVVKNSTETSKSIIQRFLGMFGNINQNASQDLSGILEGTLEKAQNLTQKVEDMLKKTISNEGN